MHLIEKRIKMSEDKSIPFFMSLTIDQLVKEQDNSEYKIDYDLFYEIKLDNEIILSVFKWNGRTDACSMKFGS